MYICPGCNRKADLDSSHVIALQRVVRVRGALEVEGEMVPMRSELFHTRCAPHPGAEWQPIEKPNA